MNEQFYEVGRWFCRFPVGSCVTIFNIPSNFGEFEDRNERFATAQRQRITHDPIRIRCEARLCHLLA